MTNSTVNGNTASGEDGSGVYNTSGGTVSLKNTMVASNIGGDCFGTIASEGYNLIQFSDGVYSFR